jgi:hypothetical protein
MTGICIVSTFSTPVIGVGFTAAWGRRYSPGTVSVVGRRTTVGLSRGVQPIGHEDIDFW